MFKQLQATTVGQRQVHQGHVERMLAQPQARLPQAAGDHDFEAQRTGDLGRGAHEPYVVIDDKQDGAI